MVLLATFGLVVFRDLTEGIVVGFALAGLVFINRMSAGTTIAESHLPVTLPKTDLNGDGVADVVVYHLNGPWFFGAAWGGAGSGGRTPPRLCCRFCRGALDRQFGGLFLYAACSENGAQGGGQLVISGARPEVRRVLHQAGVHGDQVLFVPDLAALPEALAGRLAT